MERLKKTFVDNKINRRAFLGLAAGTISIGSPLLIWHTELENIKHFRESKKESISVIRTQLQKEAIQDGMAITRAKNGKIQGNIFLDHGNITTAVNIYLERYKKPHSAVIWVSRYDNQNKETYILNISRIEKENVSFNTSNWNTSNSHAKFIRSAGLVGGYRIGDLNLEQIDDVVINIREGRVNGRDTQQALQNYAPILQLIPITDLNTRQAFLQESSEIFTEWENSI